MVDSQDKILRIIDANLNRSREGVRVIEDTARFYIDNKMLSERLKQIRHKITELARPAYMKDFELKPFRDSEFDVGKNGITDSEGERSNIVHILKVNFKRVEESLRVLEEFFKLISRESAEGYKNLRFEIYTVEKEIFKII